MAFLLLSDYVVQIKADLLNVVTDGVDTTRTDAEEAAQEEMQGFLRGRFDLAACFPDVQPYLATEQYQPGELVVLPGSAAVPGAPGSPGTPAVRPTVYRANRATVAGEQPSPGAAGAPGTPASAGPAWQLIDPRHKLLKMYLIDFTLYHLHSGQNPRAVPQLRQDRYDTALQWCRDCRTGKVSPGLPLLPDTAADGKANRESIRPRGGSGAPKLQNSF